MPHYLHSKHVFLSSCQLTETQSESSYYSPQKVKSREVLCLEQEGITIEVRPETSAPCFQTIVHQPTVLRQVQTGNTALVALLE